MASQEILRSLADAITDKPPFCTGTLPATSEECTLFYKTEGSASRQELYHTRVLFLIYLIFFGSWLDLTQATEPELEALSKACAPATFGRGDKDVFDESYRKAGKMDRCNFSTMLNIEKLGIDQRIRNQLLDASDGDKIIKSELYKLNVYGKGSFFKSHKDTPRGETMFGSLVVVFPTPHKGGALVLRHSDKEWTFDSGTLTLQDGTPSIAYIAFYSDVDHEVTVVESGYRVTLTYNLFFESEKEAMKVVSSAVPVAPDDHLLLDALSATLSDADFLPDGGYLGFGLSFKYPVSKSKTDREALVNVLKGTDALIYRVCQQASLDAFLKAVYNFKVWGSETQVMVPVTHILNPNVLYDSDHSGGIVGCVCKWHKGLVIHEVGQPEPSFRIGSWKGYYSDKTSVVQLAWVTPLTAYSNFSSTYTTYGNETSLECTYADLCIVAEVGPYGNRSTLGNAEKARIEQEKKKQSRKVRAE